jgi:type I restriction enzyme, S subunit
VNSSWPLVKLGDVLVHRKGFITIDDNQTYIRPRVQLHALGIVLRDRVSGAEIKTKKQQISKSGDFLVAEIDAKMGGFGIVPGPLDGAIVSSHYFLFEAQPEKLLREYLGYYCRTRNFRNQVEAQGSTNYAAIRPSHVLDYVMPLPTIEEQQRIVARIDTVQQQLQAADKLRQSTIAELHALCRALVINDPSTKQMMVAEVVQQRPLNVNVEPDVSYQFAGVYSFGRGVFKGGLKTGAEFAYPKLSRITSGDFIYPKLMAWEGALGVVPEACDGCVVSPEFPVFGIDKTKVLPDVFDVYFRNPSTWKSLQSGSTGTNVRRRRLNPTDFLKLKIPVPSMVTQQKLAAIRSHQRQIQGISANAESSAVLASLLNKLLT